MNCSTPSFPVFHRLLELAQIIHVHWVSDAIQPSHPLSPPSPLALTLSQHLDLFQWVSSLHQVAKVLEFQHPSVSDFIFLGSKITADGDCSHEIKRHLLLGRKVMTNLDSIFKSWDIILPTKVSSQGYGFSNSHVWMWELDCEESWAPKNWCFWTVVLEKTLESPLDCKEIQPVHSKNLTKMSQKRKTTGQYHWWT